MYVDNTFFMKLASVVSYVLTRDELNIGTNTTQHKALLPSSHRFRHVRTLASYVLTCTYDYDDIKQSYESNPLHV